MIENNDGYIEINQFIDEMKKRNLSLQDLILLYEQYKRYNYSARRTVEDELWEVK